MTRSKFGNWLSVLSRIPIFTFSITRPFITDATLSVNKLILVCINISGLSHPFSGMGLGPLELGKIASL